MDGGFGPRIIFQIGGIPITETVTNTWIIMIFLIIFSYVAGKNLSKIPKGFQGGVEALVDGIYGLVSQTMGKDKIGFAPYIGTLMIYLVFANLLGLTSLRPPTADANTTMALAFLTFFMIHGFGMKSKGVGGYLKGFTEPFFVMLPLNLIGELATPISLGFRLFGNIVGGLIIMSLLYSGLGYASTLLGSSIPFLQTAIPVPLHIYFDVFSGVLQSFIFAMLTMVFVAMAID
ncbi:MAG: F0F1 ATP synthase subunit A [Anaeromicrobium sp.]|uniref:F0F1 ATP synthase subunit A n=1 Tax=Anaeromicrobium sp. TaxID=1929132 RepID=UPI0025D5A078|nr:F0F1 ATP synthase subunit A [Anaeromicrobium sp.]MCT4592768.1 F0F1 ATP synthase subunit A [Anaeromicrobium sp.]